MINSSVDNIICVLNEMFFLESINCIGLHSSDILWSGDNPYTVSLNLYSRNITLYENGYQVTHLTNRSLVSENVDMVEYNKLRRNLFSNIDEETMGNIKSHSKKLEVFEKYEKANMVKLFLEELNG